MRVAMAKELGGIDSVEPGDLPDPVPAAGQVLVRVHGAGIGPWDVGFLMGGFPGVALPFVPGQEVAGVVEAAGDGAGVQHGERVYGSLFPAGGGFAELALVPADRLGPMPGLASFQEAAGLVIGGGTAHEGLVDRGRLRAGETVLITAAGGGVGSCAVQIAAAMGARPLGVASPGNHDYLRSLGASEVFDYHAADWVKQVRAAVPGGVDLLLDAAGGQTRDQAIGAVRDGGRAVSVVLAGPPAQTERGITAESFAAHVNRQRLEALSRLVDAGKLRPQVEAVLPLEQAREALARVAGQHTRGKVVLRIGQLPRWVTSGCGGARVPVDNDVYERLGGSWWDEASPLNLLHGSVTPGRLAYFRDVLARQTGAGQTGAGQTGAGQAGAALAGLKVLDIGCGGGFLAEEFAALGCQVTGVDPSPASIGTARAHAAGRGLRIDYRVGAGGELPVPDAAFGVACCCDVLEHVPDPERVVSETARVLEPGGLYLFDTLNRTRTSKLLAIKLMQQWPLTRLTDVAIHDWDMFITPAELAGILRRHGLAPGEMTGLGARARPLAALLGYISARRGRITYGELSRRLDVGQVSSTAVSYMGFAVKAG